MEELISTFTGGITFTSVCTSISGVETDIVIFLQERLLCPGFFAAKKAAAAAAA
jgi:hypothetical protein